MNDRQTPSTSAPTGSIEPVEPELVEPEPVELDLRDHDNGHDGLASPRDPEPAALRHEAPGELLSRREAAQRFGIDAGALRRLEKPGGLTPCRKTARGPVYYAVADLERVVSEHRPESHAREGDGGGTAAGLVLPPERLWAMVEEARVDALQARTRASAAEAEVKVLKDMVDHLLAERERASTPAHGETAAERARRFAGQWEQHEREQQHLQQQQQEPSPRGSWWPRRS
jgi:hypothetical protein